MGSPNIARNPAMLSTKRAVVGSHSCCGETSANSGSATDCNNPNNISELWQKKVGTNLCSHTALLFVLTQLIRGARVNPHLIPTKGEGGFLLPISQRPTATHVDAHNAHEAEVFQQVWGHESESVAPCEKLMRQWWSDEQLCVAPGCKRSLDESL